MPSFLHLCVSFHSLIPVISPLSHSLHFCQSRSLVLSACTNQCMWWIIHSVLWGLKLFDWQLYFLVCYIINVALLGIVAMGKAITGQRSVSSLMEWPSPRSTHLISFCSHFSASYSFWDHHLKVSQMCESLISFRVTLIETIVFLLCLWWPVWSSKPVRKNYIWSFQF